MCILERKNYLERIKLMFAYYSMPSASQHQNELETCNACDCIVPLYLNTEYRRVSDVGAGKAFCCRMETVLGTVAKAHALAGGEQGE